MKRRPNWLFLLGGVSFLVVLSANADSPDPTSAEGLLRAMEAAITKARTIDVAVEGNFEGMFQGKLKGSMLLAEGNRYRLAFQGDLLMGSMRKMPIKISMVSDGKKSTTSSLDTATPAKVVDAPQKFDTEARLFLARAGVLVPMFLLAENVQPGQKPRDFDAKEQLRVSDARMGKLEKVAGREAQVVQHGLHNRLYRTPLEVTVWLDTKSRLPLKRSVSMKQGAMAVTVTEAYARLVLDAPVGEKQFELPKAKGAD